MKEAFVVGKKLTPDTLRRLAKSAQDAERERKMLVLADQLEEKREQTEAADGPKRE